jgi:hypothetical protein
LKETIEKVIQAGFIGMRDVVAETKQGLAVDFDIYLVDRANC